MADRKARCFQLKGPPGTRLCDIKNTIEMQIDDNYITVFEEIGAHEHLVELARATHVHESSNMALMLTISTLIVILHMDII